MKIIIAPDSFKGSMRNTEVCQAIQKGVLAVLPNAEVVTLAMSDGGEGFVDSAVHAAGGEKKKVEVLDPLERKITAEYAILPGTKTAVIEMAAASGLELLENGELDPMKTSTYGTGQLIIDALDNGAKEIIIGIGGSATVDGGSGMAQALGCRLLDAEGKALGISSGGLLKLVKAVDISPSDTRLSSVSVKVACDVNNPLLGDNGAAKVFAPQKGASPGMVEELETNLSEFANILKNAGLVKDSIQPGDGAAGGLGFGLRTFCGGEMVSGAKLMCKIAGLAEHLKGADLVITGEGCTDSQTESGKLCSVIAEEAGKAAVPVVLISGALKGEHDILNSMFDAVFSIATGPCSLDEAIMNTEKNLIFTSTNVVKIFSK